MNIKSFFGIKANPEQTPAIKAMAGRVSTLAGCQELEKELAAQRQALPDFSAPARQLLRKIEELQRIQKALAMEEDRARVAAVVKRDREEASKGLKAAEEQLKAARDVAAAASLKRDERAAVVNRLNEEVASLHSQADEAVTAAQTRLGAVIGSEQTDDAAETAAFEALKKAKAHRATCAESLLSRANAHEAELRRLEALASAADADLQAAQDDVNRWRYRLALVEHDHAAQLAVDAHLKLLALPRTDSAGRAFSVGNVGALNITFASRERAVLGSMVCGEHAGLRDYALADLAKAMRPANLALLAEPLTSEAPQQEAAAPVDPYSFTPGSVAFENAQHAQRRQAMGTEAYEAALRAEQSTALQA